MLLILKTLGLRAMSWGLGAVLSPVVQIGLALAVAVGGYWLWEERIENRGAEKERAVYERAAQRAKDTAISDHAIASRWLEDQSMRDMNELAAAEAEEERVRNENQGDDVLWRADDGWLHSKTGRAPRPGRRSGADPLPGATRTGSSNAAPIPCKPPTWRYKQIRCPGLD